MVTNLPPPAASIRLIADRAVSIVPRRPTATACHHRSGSADHSGPSTSAVPAQVTTRPGGPNRASTAPKAASRSAAEVTSAASGRISLTPSPAARRKLARQLVEHVLKPQTLIRVRCQPAIERLPKGPHDVPAELRCESPAEIAGGPAEHDLGGPREVLDLEPLPQGYRLDAIGVSLADLGDQVQQRNRGRCRVRWLTPRSPGPFGGEPGILAQPHRKSVDVIEMVRRSRAQRQLGEGGQTKRQLIVLRHPREQRLPRPQPGGDVGHQRRAARGLPPRTPDQQLIGWRGRRIYRPARKADFRGTQDHLPDTPEPEASRPMMTALTSCHRRATSNSSQNISDPARRRRPSQHS